MNKISMFLSVLLVSCSTITTENRNPHCIDVKQYKVLQALETGSALAHECKYDWNKLEMDCSSYKNQLVYLEAPIEFYDDMIVKVPDNQCPVQQGVYKYETKNNSMKTVPEIRFNYNKIPQTQDKEFVNWFSKNVYDYCMIDVKDKSKCECFSDELTYKFMESLENENSDNVNDLDLIKDISKTCKID